MEGKGGSVDWQDYCLILAVLTDGRGRDGEKREGGGGGGVGDERRRVCI